MRLTPINVPGKRRRAGQPAPPRTSGRRRKLRGKAVTKTPKALPGTRGLVRKTSYLEERLPFEVLKEIFMYSENVNFVRASLRIGHFLSDVQTRREVFIRAFAGQWFFEPPESIADCNQYSYEGNPDFQSALLEYSWVNVRFIAECFEQCTRKAPRLMKSRDIFGGWVQDPEGLSEGNGSHSDAAAEKPEDYLVAHFNAFANRAKVFNSEITIRPSMKHINMVHPETLVPEALVVGPWDDESIKKLFWLIRSGARPEGSHTWEVTSRGFDAALENFDGNGIWALEMFSQAARPKLWGEWPMHVLEEAEKLTMKVKRRIIEGDKVRERFPSELIFSVSVDLIQEITSRKLAS